MTRRREFLKVSAAGLAAASMSQLLRANALDSQPAELASGTRESAVLDALDGKLPLIKRSYRPPNYETPLEYFNEAFTPNNAFFVRYHLSNIPEVKEADWRLKVGGDAVQAPFELNLAELKRGFEQVELAALCLCSGNRRGMFQPHVPGVEWGPGAMGNARWKGVRLRDVLNKAGIRKEALEVAFDGADSGVTDKTPDFVKSIPAWKALDENTLIAFEMNGAPLPSWNGFPARIVVPGWTGTYWMKHVTAINALTSPQKGFWMNPAYRIPKGKFPLVDRFTSQETDVNTPITEMVVNSLITNMTPGQRVRAGQPFEVRGIAWDAGYGVNRVDVSVDGGATWRAAELDRDFGKFSWRQWGYRFVPERAGTVIVMAKASNRAGATQTFELIHNPAGYHHNVVQRIPVDVV